MGILCDYFAAATDEQAALTVDHGPASEPDSGLPRFQTVSTKGIMPPVPTGKLQKILTGEAPDAPDDPRNGQLLAGDDDDGPWVLTLTSSLRDALANADEAQLLWAASEWARTDELTADGWTAEDALEVLVDLAGLARHAVSAGERLYCWVCL